MKAFNEIEAALGEQMNDVDPIPPVYPHEDFDTRAGMGMTEAAEAMKPLYLRMQEDLLRRVQSGEWRPGELLPSENALAAEYGVSVGTARKAIEELADRRLLVRQRGRGTTVGMHTHRQEVLRHYRLVSGTGERVNQDTSYLDVTRRAPRPPRPRRWGSTGARRSPGYAGSASTRSSAVVIEHLTLREDLLPGIGTLIDATRPEVLYAVLERQFHIIIGKVQEKVTAVRAEAPDVELLGVELGEPMLQIERIAFDLKEPRGGATDHAGAQRHALPVRIRLIRRPSSSRHPERHALRRAPAQQRILIARRRLLPMVIRRRPPSRFQAS